LEPMARWAGNAVESWSEFFSEKQHSRRLLSSGVTPGHMHANLRWIRNSLPAILLLSVYLCVLCGKSTR
jgi:hypothetical protein